ncbi:AI-2E family transporter [Clostridium hydrogenum]|uniref:AI-2E family transporter n=1 Tax=Clostridium hydrogenum TaxID=2855764 RepID=UPI001F3B21E9|nr:AI-2E family transporter [Clostridium hydrogenum]
MMKMIYKFLALILSLFLIVLLLTKVNALKEIIYLIVIGFIVAYVLKPIHVWLIGRGVNKKISAVMLIMAIIVIIVAFIFFLIPSILKETLSINFQNPEVKNYIGRVQHFLKPLIKNSPGDNLIITVYDRFNLELKKLIEKIINFVLGLGGNFVNIAILPIIAYYFLADWDDIANKLVVLFPLKYRSIIKRISADVDEVLGKYTISQFLLCILIGLFTFFTLIILKVKYPLLLSIINGLFNIVPYFGPLFGAVPAVIVALLESPKQAVYTAVFLYLVQLIEGNVISPKVTGDSINMHPLVVIILLIVGEKIAGFGGMVFAVPIGVILKVIYEDLNYYLF